MNFLETRKYELQAKAPSAQTVGHPESNKLDWTGQNAHCSGAVDSE